MEISISVTPNSKKAEVVQLDNSTYRVKVDAPAVEGKANKRLIEILADYFNVSKSSISVVRGNKGRKKLIKISL